jgi:hypothetical protein
VFFRAVGSEVNDSKIYEACEVAVQGEASCRPLCRTLLGLGSRPILGFRIKKRRSCHL